MPRVSLKLELTREQRVAALASAHAALKAAEHDALTRAREIGDLLRDVPEEDRVTVAREAGIGRRSAFEYLRVAVNWVTVSAARCTSLRQAVALLTTAAKRVPSTYEETTASLDPGLLARALERFRGRPVTIWLRPVADTSKTPRTRDKRQRDLPL